MQPVSFIRTSPRKRGEEQEGTYEQPLSLDTLFVTHPSATFFIRVGTVIDANEHYDIEEGDILVVDRAIEPTAHRLTLVVEAGELKLVRWHESIHTELEYWGTVVALARYA